MELATTSKNLKKIVLVIGIALLGSAGQVWAAVIQSVQRGTATFASGQNTLPVTLAVVDPAKTIVWGGINWGGGRINISDPNASRVGFQLSNGTTLDLQRLGAPAYATAVEWQAIEFAAGVAVQRRDTTFAVGTTTINVPISAVNLSESFVLVSVAANTGSQTIDEQWTVRAQLTSATNLELSRNESGIALNAYWQVVSFTGASVQRGLTTIGAGANSATAAISSVNTATTFLLSTQRGAAAVNGSESQYQVRGRITSPTQLTFDRTSTTNSVEIAWEVVTLNDGSNVQSGGIAMAGTDTTATAALSSVTVSNSASFISVRGGTGAETADLDATSFSHTIVNSDTFRVWRSRQGTATAADVAWFVVQFPQNQAPVLSPIGPQSTTETQLLEFRVSATDPNATIPSLSAENLPGGAVFVDSLNGAGSFSWTPSLGQAGLYNVTFIAADGSLADSEVVTIAVDSIPTGIGDINPGQLPKRYSLSQNYPNPFNANTQIIFALPKSGHATLEIFNLLGQKVGTLVDEQLSAGTKIVSWDGRDKRGETVPSGIYFYQLRSGDYIEKKKMVFLK
jgi:hypothetical protein